MPRKQARPQARHKTIKRNGAIARGFIFLKYLIRQNPSRKVVAKQCVNCNWTAYRQRWTEMFYCPVCKGTTKCETYERKQV